MKTIDTKTLNNVSGAWHGGWGGYGYGYGGWANPYAQVYRAERAAAWAYRNAANPWLPVAAAYAASRW